MNDDGVNWLYTIDHKLSKRCKAVVVQSLILMWTQVVKRIFDQ